MMHKYLGGSLGKYNSHNWRIERYWVEESDKVIKENMQTLEDIYNQFASPNSPGEPKVMRHNKLIDLITESGVIDDSFGAKEIGVIYNLSMMTQVDEIHSTRHMDMRFIEFVESIARVADKAITRSTQEFVGRDPSQSGIQGAIDGTSNLSASKLASSVKKGASAALEASANRDRS